MRKINYFSQIIHVEKINVLISQLSDMRVESEESIILITHSRDDGVRLSNTQLIINIIDNDIEDTRSKFIVI